MVRPIYDIESYLRTSQEILKMHKIIQDAEARMGKSLDLLKNQYCALWVGNCGWLDTVKVEYHGSWTPLNRLANIGPTNNNKITITPHDPSTQREIVTALNRVWLGMQVFSDKTGIHLVVPRMDSGLQDQMVTYAERLANEAKTAIRNIRQADRKKVKYEKMSEDEEKRIDKGLQTSTDKYCEQVDLLCQQKVKKIRG